MIRKSDHGFAMVGTLAVAVGLLTVASGLLVYSSVSNKRAVIEEQQVRAFYAAESGLNHVLALMRKGWVPPQGRIQIFSQAGTKPVYEVWLDVDGNGQMQIASQGIDGKAMRNVSVDVTELSSNVGGGGGAGGGDGQAPISWPTCACSITTPYKGKLSVNNNQSYTISAPALYSSITTKNNVTLDITANGEVKSNGNISTGNNAKVYLKPTTGLTLCGATVTFDNNAIVDVTGPTSICATTFRLQNNTKLQLNVDGAMSVCANNIYMNNNDSLKFGANAGFIAWATGNLELMNNFSTFDYGNSSQDPALWPRFIVGRKLHIHNNARLGSQSGRPVLVFLDPAYTDTVIIDNNAVVYGLIWAPTREVQLGNNAVVRGKVVAKKVTGSGVVVSSGVNFDDIRLPWTSGAGSGEIIFGDYKAN